MLPTFAAYLRYSCFAAAGALALGALTNFMIDPSAVYWRRHKQPRNLRLRKMELLRLMGQRASAAPLGTLILGSSRVFNLMLSGNPAFSQPVFNFAVTAAKAEDYLACWESVAATQPAPPKLLIVCLELAAFHPSLAVEWEAYTAPAYRRLLVQSGMLPAGNLWRLALLFNHVQLRHTLTDMQRALRGRDKYGPKFRWNPDGSATWHDLLRGYRSPRLLARQLRTYPRNGVAIRSYDRLGAGRQHCFLELLRKAQASGTRVICYLAPEHPLLIQRLGAKGAQVHQLVSAWLGQVCSGSEARFLDLWDGRQCSLGEADYRDAMHLVDTAQEQVEGLLAKAALAPAVEGNAKRT